ncbi:MAG: WYL domain-containing protein [Candidatus Bipolaricaulis sp.]|nr:WYL domain-containing protein [Candidatus Bipolaricaulis sp.]
MRADRLLSLLTLLESRGRLTTDHLARELEVSRRTVLRDLFALRVAGFPVNSVAGPGGGCWLEDDFRNRLLHLSQGELAALFSLSVPAPLVELGVADDLKGALGKLASALPPIRSDTEARMRQRIHLDSVPWSAPLEAVPHLTTLHRASLEDRWATATFARAGGTCSRRRIAPYGLVAKATTWYVVWSGEDDRLRVDRVSRVMDAEILRATFVRPSGFVLAHFWSAWCQKQEGREPWLSVTARVSADALDELRRSAALRLEAAPSAHGPEDPRRPHRVRMRFATVEEARSHLLSYGGSVEVLDPLALRLTLADFAEQALRVYGSAAASSAKGS